MKKYNSSNDSNYSKSIKKKSDKKKRRRKHKKQDAPDSSSSNYDSSDDSDYRRKRRKKKSHRKTDPIKLCACLTEKLLTIAYKSKIIRFKMDAPDLFPHMCRITGDDISQYKETSEVLLDYPKIGRENIK